MVIPDLREVFLNNLKQIVSFLVYQFISIYNETCVPMQNGYALVRDLPTAKIINKNNDILTTH